MYFNKSLYILGIFYSGQYITVSYTPIHHVQCIFNYIQLSSQGNHKRKQLLQRNCHNFSDNNFQKAIKTNWTKIHFYNLTSLAYSPPNKYMLKVIFEPVRRQLTVHKFSSLFIIKLLSNLTLYLKCAFISHVICLGKTSNTWYKWSDECNWRLHSSLLRDRGNPLGFVYFFIFKTSFFSLKLYWPLSFTSFHVRIWSRYWKVNKSEGSKY